MPAAAGLDRPRFRQDLIAETIEDQGSKFIDVADPDGLSVFRFYEAEFSIACGMDGERDIAGIVKWAQDELGLKSSPAEVKNVIVTLANLGYLDGTDAARAAATATPARSTQDRDLAPGVVVGTQRPAPSGADVELGQAGSRGIARAEMPKAPDLALGAPGASAAKAPRAPAENVTLGASGMSAVVQENMSLDLSDQVVVRPDDVKEAVRQSKVMSAVDVPKDLLDSLEDKPQTPASRPGAKAATPSTTRPIEQSKPAKQADKPVSSTRPTEPSKPVIAAAAKASEKPVSATRPTEPSKAIEKPTEKPTEPSKTIEKPIEKLIETPVVAVATKATEKPAIVAKPVEPLKQPVEVKKPAADKEPVAAPESRTSPALIVLLILAVLALGAFLVWKYVLKKAEQPQTTGQSVTPTAPDEVKPPEVTPPPPEPPVAVSKLALETLAPIELKAVAAGQLEPFPALKVVKRGDVIASLVGGRKLKGEVAILTREIERVGKQVTDAQKKLDDATSGNKPAPVIKDLTDRLADRVQSKTTKETALAAKQAELDTRSIKAPTDGQVTYVAKPNTAVTAETTIATVAPAPAMTTTFKTDGSPAVASAVLVKVKETEVTIGCTVAESSADGVKVACPVDNALEGKEVTYAGPATDETPTTPTPPADKPVEAGDKPTDPPATKPAPKVQPRPKTPKPKPADKPVDPPADKPADPPADKPADGSASP
ncbi:MAG: hypothetical protein WKG01_33485 [Kofleriaceae bacterium]